MYCGRWRIYMTFLLIICWDEQTIRNGEAMPERHFILPEGASGEGISKGNLVPLGPPVGVRDPLRRGPGFLLLFSIKSKEESPCFAEKVPNGRTTNLVQEIFCANALNQCEALLFFARLRPIGACAANSPLLKSPSSSTLSAFSANPPTAPSPAPHPPAAQPQADA